MSRLSAGLTAATRPARERVREALEPIALAAIAAALAWLIAHRLLGHPEPFFAPIAAAIAISTSRIQRSRRTAQMVAGVLLGIGVGEALSAALGTSMTALAVIVFVTMAVAVLLGAGFVGQGMMFANQAAASAILVATLHRHGTGSERALDAVVGGAVAFTLGVILFPAHPMAILRNAERTVLATLAAVLRRSTSAEQPSRGQDWLLAVSQEIQRGLSDLARARATAHANVRVAPRRWNLREAVDLQTLRTGGIDLLANDVLFLVRSAADEQPLPEPLDRQVTALGLAIERLARTPQPWPEAVRREVSQAAMQAAADAERHRQGDRGAATRMLLGSASADLAQLLEAVAKPPAVAPLAPP